MTCSKVHVINMGADRGAPFDSPSIGSFFFPNAPLILAILQKNWSIYHKVMGKKDKKSAEHKARVAAKQSKKSAQKEKKSKAKGKDADSDAEDADLDAILAQYAEEQTKFLKVTEVVSEPPAPRSSATVLASPSNRNELLLFGGEHFDGIHATFYNNLFVYLIDRGEWREVTSPNSPLPRSGHAWCRGGNTGGVYLFGGKITH